MLLALAAVLVLGTANVLAAELVRDLYVAEVPVTDRSNAELARASTEALAQVLVKVSGSTEVLTLPEVAQALRAARGQVLKYSYVRMESEGAVGLAARVEFDPPEVRDLLARAGAPIWTANRPSVLVWLVFDDGAGRRFVSPATEPGLATALANQFRLRGVPVRFPLLDLADLAALDPDQAWQLPLEELQAASARYGVADLLAGRMALLDGDQVAGDWLYLAAQVRQGSSAARVDSDGFLRQGVTLAVEGMAARYAVSLQAQTGDGIGMTVSGIDSYAAYAAVVSWLESLEPIERAQVVAVRGDVLELRLLATADPSQLLPIIGLNPRLQADGSGLMPGLVFRWQN